MGYFETSSMSPRKRLYFRVDKFKRISLSPCGIIFSLIMFLGNFIHQQAIEKNNKQKIINSKHQNTIDVQDYQAYVAYKINCK